MQYFKLSNHAIAARIRLGCLLLLIFLMPFDEGGNGCRGQLFIQSMLLLCGTLWALQAIRRRQIVFQWNWFDVVVVGFFGWATCSLVIADYRYAAIFELLKLLVYVVLLYELRTLFPLQNARLILLLAIVGSSLLQVLVGLFAVVMHQSPVLHAGFVNPNELACFLVLGSTILLSLLLFHPQASMFLRMLQERKFSIPVSSWGTWGLGLLAFLGLGSATFVLQSRGAVLGFVLTGGVLLFLRNKKASLIFLGIISLLILLPLPHGSLLTRLSKRHDPFAYQRVDIWKSSLRMIADHPLIGVGLGMYKYHAPTYNFPVEGQIARYGKRLDLAHNDLLQITAESGLIGLLICSGGIVLLGYYSLCQLRTAPRDWSSVAAAVGILGILLQGLVSNLVLSPAIALSVVILVSILLDGEGNLRQRAVTIQTSAKGMWQWYAGLSVIVIYVLGLLILTPFWGHVHFLKYQQLLKQGQINAAVAHLRKAVQWVPIQAYYHAAFGELYATAFRNQPNLDAFYESYKSFTTAIQHNPLEADFYAGLAELHRAMYRQKLPTRPTAENAVRDYQRALQYDPFNPFLRVSLATLYADLGEFEQALTLVREAVTLEPNFVGGYQLLGRMLAHLQRQPEAQAAFQRADEILTRYDDVETDSDYVRSLLRPLRQ